MTRTDSSRRRWALVSLAALALLCCQGSAEAPPTDEGLQERDTSEANLNAIRGVMATYMTATNQGDVGALVGLFSDDAVRLPPNTQALEGIDRIRDNLVTIHETYDIEATVIVEEARFSGDFAVARGTWALTLHPKSGGEPRDDVGKWLNLMERQPNGAWKISRNIWNSNRPAGEAVDVWS